MLHRIFLVASHPFFTFYRGLPVCWLQTYKKERTKNEARLIFSSDRLALFNDGNDPAAFHPILFPPPSFYFVWLLPPSPPLRAQEKGPTEMQRFFPFCRSDEQGEKRAKLTGWGALIFPGRRASSEFLPPTLKSAAFLKGFFF